MKKRWIHLLLCCSISATAIAQNKDTVRSSTLVFELPVLDLPYQADASKTVDDGAVSVGGFFKGYANPSMHQSLNLSSDLYTGAHYGFKQLFKKNNKSTFGKRLLYSLALCGSDFVLIYAPGFEGWTHEEFHRSVMTRFHVNSFNDMNTFPLGAELISVNHVKDDDLIRFKLESPKDFIRMHVAGIEGDYLLVDKLQRNNFYYNQQLPHEVLYLLTSLNSIMYVQLCSNPSQANVLTDTMNFQEKEIPLRDFTGLDFLGWTYDLFRPNEPYTDRGVHPTGIGIDRYIKTSDLTNEELSYLKKQGDLQWLNAVSPMLYGYRSIKLSNGGLSGNFSLHHYLTSFGNDISVNLFLMNPKYRFFFAYHHYQNYQSTFPAIESQLVDLEKTIGSHTFYISPRVLIGIQPTNQEFKTTNSSFMGLAECKLELKSKSWIHPYIELSAKTDGWVAGNEFLNSNFSCRFGIVSRISTIK